MKKQNMYTFDLMNNTITFSHKLITALNNGDEVAYNTYTKIRRDFPKATVYTAPKPKRKGKTPITYADMKRYIKQCQNSKMLLAKFDQICEAAKADRSAYNTVCKWFKMSFPQYGIPSHDKLDDSNKIIVANSATIIKSEVEIREKVVPLTATTNDDQKDALPLAAGNE